MFHADCSHSSISKYRPKVKYGNFSKLRADNSDCSENFCACSKNFWAVCIHQRTPTYPGILETYSSIHLVCFSICHHMPKSPYAPHTLALYARQRL